VEYALFINPQSQLSSLGHFLYTLYIIPLGPGSDPVLAFVTTYHTSFYVGSSVSRGIFVVALTLIYRSLQGLPLLSRLSVFLLGRLPPHAACC
jgi:hypothetical protein